MKYKRIKMPAWLMIVGLLFGLSVLGVSGVKVKAQEGTVEVEEAMSEPAEGEFEVEQEESESEEMAVMSMEKPVTAVDYYLPYPGILPDHPLYWLKMIRDRVQLWLTTNPEAKAEKLLLYADKRLGAGWALVEGNKVQLGVTTLTKAEKYLEQAILSVEKLEEGSSLVEKISKADLKHKEVLMIVKDKVGNEYQAVIDQMLKIGQPATEMEEEINIEVDEEMVMEEEVVEGEVEDSNY